MLPDYKDVTNVSRETYDRLVAYYSLLVKWQKKINLISSKDQSDVWERHFVDSLQIIDIIPDNSKTLYDFGSGGGFPGLVVGLSTGLEVTLVESDSRKCSFLKAVSRETNAQNVSVINDRVENIDCPAPDIVSARALSSLIELFDYSWDLWNDECVDICFIFLKGQNWRNEILEAQKKYKFKFEEFKSSTSENAKILKIQDLCSG